MSHPTAPESDGEPAGQGCLGSAMLIFGIAVFCVAAMEAAGPPFRLPRMWHVNRSLWILLALAAISGGCALLRSRRPDADRRRAPFHSVILYTRPGCHLCDDARLVLEKYAADLPEIVEVNIDTDPALVERFGTEIPVVEIDGRVRFRGRVNEVLLQRLIEGRRRREFV